MKQKFIIEDWAGNVCFFGKEFNDFETAWGFIYEQYPDENDEESLQEYEVVEK